MSLARPTERPIHVGAVGEPPAAVVLRPIDDGDEQFLRDLYASTRSHERAAVNWTAEQWRSFCDAQFDFQDSHYREEFPAATFDSIEWGGRQVGRLLVSFDGVECHVLDIALCPAERGAGLGTLLLQWLQIRAAECAVPVVLWVDRGSGALRLYTRLGFAIEAESELNLRLTWNHSALGSDAWTRFESLALGDVALRAQLRVATNDVELSAIAVSLGLARGLVFSADDVMASLRTQRRAWIERSIS
jgi:GNAT superfamily N-acetyltransferase